MQVKGSKRCPCGTGDTLADCCGRYLVGVGEGRLAPTAATLMRSRYTAFALGDVDHLLATWHPTTRPAVLELDDDRRWLHLAVGATSAGGPFDDAGTVEFTAVYRGPGGRGEMRELSRFVRDDGRWLYLDGDVS